jgi:tripartite-type tricarboxylate transporter receptor subunit TctC
VLGKDYEAYSWFGLVAPKGTPEPVLQKLRAAFTKAAQAAEVRRQLAEQGLEPGIPDVQAFGAMIAADVKKWSGIIVRARVEAD